MLARLWVLVTQGSAICIYMNDINILFFELIRVAIGTQLSLSRQPSPKEWAALYDIAKKQSLVGVCFAAVQKLNSANPSNTSNLSELQYLTWMGMAAKIQQWNEVVNRQCVELQAKLSTDGLQSAILKGQGVASLYCEHLRGLRQSGDIDILAWKDGFSCKENKRAIIEWARNMGADEQGSKHHISVPIYEDTEVELHYTATYLCNPFANIRMQKWLGEKIKTITTKNALIVPDIRFNIVFMLSHTFRHCMSEGVGLRQLMDYYFVLRTVPKGFNDSEFQSILKSMNMLKFAGAVMWVIKTVFIGHDNVDDNDDLFLGIKPNERLGRKLLAHVMQGGNFGHHNKGTVVSKNSHIGMFVNQLYHDLSIAFDYPCEAIWAPLAMIRNFVRLHK